MASSADRVATTLFLVRHGEADSNRESRFGGHSPSPLTERGRAQAAAVAARLAGVGASALITSDVVRAAQTAEAIAQATGLAASATPLWRERSVGIFDGLRFDEAKDQHPTLWEAFMADRHFCVPPGGEITTAIFARIGEGLAQIIAGHRGQRVVVVSHGIAIFNALCHVVGAGAPTDHTPFFALVDNASITTIEHVTEPATGRQRFWIKSLNEVAHLSGLAQATVAGQAT